MFTAVSWETASASEDKLFKKKKQFSFFHSQLNLRVYNWL